MIRSKAPLRLGIAGGGTDVSPFSDVYGGSVLNATINLFAHAFIEPLQDSDLTYFIAKDLNIEDSIRIDKDINIEDGPLRLHRAVYKKIMNEYNNGKNIPLRVITQCDAPPGSGLGSSSTLVVSMIEGYRRLLNLPFGEYDIAHLAYEIERLDCKLTGGKQDQYAASFGGFNFIEFFKNDRVIVNPLRVKRNILHELESSMILFYTGASRDSAKIIEDQISSLSNSSTKPLEAMLSLKKSSYRIKELLLKGHVMELASEFKTSWEHKKRTSPSITNDQIDKIEQAIYDAGALSMKVSGAGGGGFMMIFVVPENKLDVERALSMFDGSIHKFQFYHKGCISWKI